MHDGIYAQHEWDMYNLTTEDIEKEILEQVGINVKLGAETSDAGKEIQDNRRVMIDELVVETLGFGVA